MRNFLLIGEGKPPKRASIDANARASGRWSSTRVYVATVTSPLIELVG